MVLKAQNPNPCSPLQLLHNAVVLYRPQWPPCKWAFSNGWLDFFLVRWQGLGYISENIQGGFFNCSHPKFSKYKKKTKYPNCSYPKFSKYKKKIKYLNCSHPKISECGKVKILKQTNKKHRIFNSDKTLLLVLCASVINLFNVHVWF